MKHAFDQASQAHARRDGTAARSYADQGHRHKAEAQGYVAERRRLVQEIRDASARHAATKPAFEHASAQYSRARQYFDWAKAEHERAQAEFKKAKADFDMAAEAFRRYREQRQAAGRGVARHGRLEGRWYSKYMSGDGSIQVMLDKFGNVTNRYPHVHVIHDEPGGQVRIHVTLSAGVHVDHEVLPGDTSGNEVNAAIERAIQRLRQYS